MTFDTYKRWPRNGTQAAWRRSSVLVGRVSDGQFSGARRPREAGRVRPHGHARRRWLPVGRRLSVRGGGLAAGGAGLAAATGLAALPGLLERGRGPRGGGQVGRRPVVAAAASSRRRRSILHPVYAGIRVTVAVDGSSARSATAGRTALGRIVLVADINDEVAVALVATVRFLKTKSNN